MTGPELPIEAHDLWVALSRIRVVTAQEIDAYIAVTGIELSQWEITTLYELDRLRHGH